jgi:hypothetical protein
MVQDAFPPLAEHLTKTTILPIPEVNFFVLDEKSNHNMLNVALHELRLEIQNVQDCIQSAWIRNGKFRIGKSAKGLIQFK